jgi:hypothetical protein
MNEQRAFSVVVTGCKNCPEPYYDEAYGTYGCGRNDTSTIGKEFTLYKQNQNAITPTCPMWNEAKPIGELK